MPCIFLVCNIQACLEFHKTQKHYPIFLILIQKKIVFLQFEKFLILLQNQEKINYVL